MTQKKLVCRIIPLIILLLGFLIQGCYKEDLAEFKKVKTVKYNPDVAVPVIRTFIELGDTLPYIPNVILEDTTEIDLGGDLKLNDTIADYIEFIEFKGRYKNTFNLFGDIQIYIADSSNVFIDSLFTNYKDNLTPNTSTPFTITLSAARALKISNKGRNIFVRSKLQTTKATVANNGSYIELFLGARVKFKSSYSSK